MPPSLKIDVYAHILPRKYRDTLFRVAPPSQLQRKLIETAPPTVFDDDARFRQMDKYEGLMQVIVPCFTPMEETSTPEKTAYLIKTYNDEMAELVTKYPDRFAAAIAILQMNDMEAALTEADRAIRDLRLRGILMDTPVNDRPLDSPEFLPLYEKMAQHELPIWIHPRRTPDYADYRTEKRSLYEANLIYGWPYETTVAMHRLVYSGIMERYPGLKFITHHCGGMVPYLADRIICFYDRNEMGPRDEYKNKLKRSPLDYFRSFYNDTALYGSPAGLMCAYAFCGADHILFGTDMPWDNQNGDRFIGQTISAIRQMAISDDDKQKIFAGNARQLLRLPV